MNSELSVKEIGQRIYVIRGRRVMLDSDLAELYGVKTFNLNKAVKRNIERFPNDFMFQLNVEEYDSLIFQIGISKVGRGGRRFLPYGFTEQGVAMLSSVLNSERAVQVNIAIVRAFVQLRELLETNKGLAKQLDLLERRFERKFYQHDENFRTVFDDIRKLIEEGASNPRKKVHGLG